MVTATKKERRSTPPLDSSEILARETEPRTPEPGWRYQHDGKRDLRIDLLRGFAVFAMVVDHIGGPSWLYILTGGNRFFVSAAEGFVFISGLMVGLVYGTRVRLGGLRSVLSNLMQRAWTLYVLAVWLALGTTLVAAVFSLPGGHGLATDPARFVWEIISTQRTSYLVDVMLLYCFLMLLSPLALLALRRRAWPLIALVSVAAWAVYQFAPQFMQLPWPIADNVVFKLASWQILFVAGLLIGYERQNLGQFFRERTPTSARRLWPLCVVVAFAALVWLHRTNGAPLALLTSRDPAGLLDAWFDKSALPPARLAACVVVFALAWALISRCWRPISRATGWLLLPLGQAALYAYAAHLFLIPVTELLVMRVNPRAAESGTLALHPAVNAGLQVVAVLLLWQLTRTRFLASTVAPLGQPPLIRWNRQAMARPLWRPSDALLLLLVLALASAPLRALSLTEGLPAPASASRSVGSGMNARPESTVTAPRKIAGAARGSATGGGEQPAPALSAPASGHAASDDVSDATVASASELVQAQPARSASVLASVANTTERGESYDESVAAVVPEGYLLDGEFFSQSLDRGMPYGIYLPPGYDFGTKRYPVLYMLHGSGGHYSEWVGYGLIETAEELIETGQIPPMIIVLPQGDGSFWVNQTGPGGERWGDYLVDDLLQHIDTTYRTVATAHGRAIGGLSMGGFGALSLGFKHPDIFQMIGAHSPSLRTWAEAPDVLGNREEYAAIDPAEIAPTVDPKNEPAIWLDVGRRDEWAERVRSFHDLLRDLKIGHKFQEKVGEHDSDYWAKQIPQYLKFYAGMSTNE